ncbi:MAG: YbaB/EbfC family nucleoid-associated protein [Elusimicrobiota bacterium]|jgi:DNA-binding protein YbaB|nr:YbaB/EbfC family nucleoid-associated protein [Elusimicrobiota bacterium]
MELFKMAKEAMAMKSKINEMDKKLKSHILEVEHKAIKIKVNAKNEFLELNIPDDLLKKNKTEIEKLLLSAFCEAGKKAQVVMAEEAKKITGGMKIPGL